MNSDISVRSHLYYLVYLATPSPILCRHLYPSDVERCNRALVECGNELSWIDVSTALSIGIDLYVLEELAP